MRAVAVALLSASGVARAGESVDQTDLDGEIGAWGSGLEAASRGPVGSITGSMGGPRWRDRTPSEAGQIVDVALHPARSGAVAVADRSGRVFVSYDAGFRWRIEREPGSGAGLAGKEDLLLDLQVRWREIRLREPGIGTGPPVAGDDLVDRLSREELLAEHELLPRFVYRELPGAVAPPLALAWVGDTVVASDGDGWWVAALGPTAAAAAPAKSQRYAPPAGAPVDAADGASAIDADGATWVWSSAGVWRIEPDLGAVIALPGEYPSLGDLFVATADRAGLARTGLRGRRGAAAIVPSLVAEAWTGNVDALRWSRVGTVRDVVAETFIGVRAVWTPRRPRIGPGGIDLAVVDGRVHPLTGVDDQVVASYLDRAAVDYTARLQTAVRELYLDRAAWTARLDAPAAPLLDRVDAALSVAEIDALLDAWCDGAVSRRRSVEDL